MLRFFTEVVRHYGYVAVGLLVMVEGFGVPLPGETAVVAAAAFAARGSLSIVGVALAATIGTVLGGSGGYWIGRSGGRALLLRHGHLVGLDADTLERAERRFVEHRMKTVFLARFVALLRILGGLLAGATHMPFGEFTTVNFAGGLLWAVTFSALGYVFGRNLHLLEHRLGQASLAVLIVLAAGAFVVVRRRRGAVAR
jgi:membrane protein DedA with SNARE-associated domain